jgi:hypothetical protein
MTKKKKIIVSIIIIFLWFIFFSPLGIASTFGIRPVSHMCVGLLVSPDKISLPKGDITFFSIGIRYFRYYVPENLIEPLCVGIDVWYGE